MVQLVKPLLDSIIMKGKHFGHDGFSSLGNGKKIDCDSVASKYKIVKYNIVVKEMKYRS